MLSSLIKNLTPKNLIVVFTALLFFSCQKEISNDTGGSIVTTLPDLSTKISSSVSGFVTDENDAAVKGATIQFGASAITTDKYGYFEAKNVQVVKEAAVVTVSKPGYFKGIKTYFAKEGKSAFFRIKLISKTIAGNVNASSGGTVTLSNGLSIKLPAGGIVNAATNTAYTGTVNVAAYLISPAASDLANIMPGDQRGINTAGYLKLLQTFGVAAVELTGASGELLQIANGQKATLTLPIPSSLSASAPASIPLWYFDEAKGLWKEEGSATKTGNTYVGEVGHFSFWDYAPPPGNYVQFECTIVDQNANPMSFVWVYISEANNPNYGRYGYTDASGYVNGPVPANAQLILEVYSTAPIICSPAYTQNLTTSGNNISLGNVIVTSNASWASVQGTVTDCNNNLVSNGHLIIHTNNYFSFYPLNNSGHFIFYEPLCNVSSIPVDILPVDANNQQQNNNFTTYTITTGNNNIGNIVACGNSTQVFLNYTINNTNYSIIDTLGGYTNGNSFNVYGTTINHTNNAYFQFDLQNIGMGSSQSLISFECDQTGQTSISNPISVHITEYGPAGQFVSGNFTGNVTSASPPNNNYAITGNFRVRHF